jgi:hypothetical protein
MRKIKMVLLVLMLLLTQGKSHAGIIVGSWGAITAISEIGDGHPEKPLNIVVSTVLGGGLLYGWLKGGQKLMSMFPKGSEGYHAGAMLIVLGENSQKDINESVSELFPFLSDDLTIIQELSDLLLSKFSGEGIEEVKLTEEEVDNLIRRADISNENISILKKQLL